ncbi:MAG TPA: hypothetical protein VK453_01140 [Micromonosporaceae bacterium]|nr:hypothetical protein [Micromonosporaceae bacterium]
MYEWIWRHLPFGLPGKIIGSSLLIAAAVAVLWFKVFAMVEPLLPNTDGQIIQSGTSTGAVEPTPPPGGPAPGGASDPGVRGSNPGASATAASLRARSSQPRSPQPRSTSPRSPQPSR